MQDCRLSHLLLYNRPCCDEASPAVVSVGATQALRMHCVHHATLDAVPRMASLNSWLPVCGVSCRIAGPDMSVHGSAAYMQESCLPQAAAGPSGSGMLPCVLVPCRTSQAKVLTRQCMH
jgi:hypothetical protein